MCPHRGEHMTNIYRQYTHNRSVGWSTWHLEWCTKYRYKIFNTSKYKNLCTILLYESAKRYHFTIFDCEVDVNHVHVIASLPLSMTPLDVIHNMKGYTSKCLFVLLPHLRKIYKRKHLWSPGKFVGSVGHITLEKAKEYLKEHHAKLLMTGIPDFSQCEKFARRQTFRSGRMSILRSKIFSLLNSIYRKRN
jgi:putative transposase